MAIKGFNPKKLYKYIPHCERGDPEKKIPPADNPAFFMLKVLTPQELAEIENKIAAAVPNESGQVQRVEIATDIGSIKLATLKGGLRGWGNITMPRDDGQGDIDAPFKVDDQGQPTNDTIAVLHPELRDELANAITELNDLSEEDLKN